VDDDLNDELFVDIFQMVELQPLQLTANSR
jgi:hypothetical protein